YRTALDNTQKAIDFAKIRRDKSAEAKATLALGVIYLELKKFDDADQLLNRSITLYKTLPPSSELAYAYYNLGLANIEEEDFIRAESNFDRAGEIYKAINIPDAIELLDLQRGII